MRQKQVMIFDKRILLHQHSNRMDRRNENTK